MSEHKAFILWENTSAPGEFTKGRYSREHTWKFDGGVSIPASPSPSVVRPPFSNPDCVDPEEAFVAAISSCHMLTYLFLAGRKGFQVERYQDEAVGVMTQNDAGVPWVSRITLNVRVQYGPNAPSSEEEDHLHHEAHEQCYIANSVKTEIVVSKSSASVGGTSMHQ